MVFVTITDRGKCIP